MEGSHGSDAVRQYDLIKAVVAVVLLVLAIVPWLRPDVDAQKVSTPFALTGAAAVGQAVRLSGKGHPGAEVAILEGSGILSESLVDKAGSWTLDLPVPFGDPATIKVREVSPKDGAERTLGFSGAPSFLAATKGFPNGGRMPDAATPPSQESDPKAPSTTEPGGSKPAEAKPEDPSPNQPPVPLSLATNSFTSGTGQLAGTAPAGQRVVVSVEGTVVCAAVASDDGSWTCQAEVLRGGARKVSISSGKSVSSATLQVAGGASQDVRREISAPLRGARRPAGAVAVYGWGLPDERVEIRVGRHLKRRAFVDRNGRWVARLSLMKGSKLIEAQIGPVKRKTALRIR